MSLVQRCGQKEQRDAMHVRAKTSLQTATLKPTWNQPGHTPGCPQRTVHFLSGVLAPESPDDSLGQKWAN